MSALDGETKRKLREMNAGELLEAIDTQDDTLSINLTFEERVRLVVDDAHSTFMHSKIAGLIRRASLRYPNADLRRIDLLDERGLNRQQNVVFHGFNESGKSYLGCAIAKRACEHRIRAHYVRMPDLEEAWGAAQDTPAGPRNSCAGMRASRCWSLTSGCWPADGVDGAPLRQNVDGLLHPVSAEGLAPAPRLRGSRRRDYRPHHPQHRLG